MQESKLGSFLSHPIQYVLGSHISDGEMHRLIDKYGQRKELNKLKAPTIVSPHESGVEMFYAMAYPRGEIFIVEVAGTRTRLSDGETRSDSFEFSVPKAEFAKYIQARLA